MGTVCAAILSLMDGGVPIKAPVAGVAMGLVSEGDQVAILSDILGDEDHTGDMDFKVAGTRDGITALQMDIKIHELSRDIMEEALAQAKKGRLHIIDEMEASLGAPRNTISSYAPVIVTVEINPDKIRDIQTISPESLRTPLWISVLETPMPGKSNSAGPVSFFHRNMHGQCAANGKKQPYPFLCLPVRE